jgi:ectoine hydroxylase-related dioxygenase (phytanoyl-CoA dioxygenase family)
MLLLAAHERRTMNLPQYGVKEMNRARSASDVHAERVSLVGYSVIESVVPEPTLVRLRALIDYHLAAQAAHAGGAAVLESLGEAGTLRASVALDPLFLAVATNPEVMEVCQRLLGDYFTLLLQNSIVVDPQPSAHHQASFHRDLPYQHFVSSRPISINAMLCVDPFTVETGCTHVLPGSHKQERFPALETVEATVFPLEAPAGSFLVFDAMMYHRSGINRSSIRRRGINSAYCLPFVKQQISLPRLFQGKHADDPFLARFLGYDSEPPESIAAWYAERKRKVKLPY